ncbi:hypothetical protein JX265_013692 [Neoarthrinium moseri]|uniref:Ecp2 effector protein-like domain-containing protein n=1 Tax=Neoarthrinium moseri TaxID=1658444 RepID=A0A9Q0AHF5_9PEZI|nr:hypothetical protein JX265_013692 [Neoarthrinium moseri]
MDHKASLILTTLLSLITLISGQCQKYVFDAGIPYGQGNPGELIFASNNAITYHNMEVVAHQWTDNRLSSVHDPGQAIYTCSNTTVTDMSTVFPEFSARVEDCEIIVSLLGEINFCHGLWSQEDWYESRKTQLLIRAGSCSFGFLWWGEAQSGSSAWHYHFGDGDLRNIVQQAIDTAKKAGQSNMSATGLLNCQEPDIKFRWQLPVWMEEGSSLANH